MLLKTATIAALLINLSPLAAQSSGRDADSEQPGGSFSTGIGVVASYNAIQGASNRVMVVPVFFYESERFYFRGIQAGYRFYNDQALSLSLDLRAEFQSWKPSDSPVLQGMNTRKVTAEGGLNARYRINNWEWRAGLWQDIFGRHKGWQGELALAYNHRINHRWLIIPRIEILTVSSKKADYYFGVREEEALPQRPQYSVGSTYSLALAASLRYQINYRWNAYADIGAAYLSSDIRNSPIVDRRWLPRIITGLSYRW